MICLDGFQDYYSTPGVREVCHAVKDGNRSSREVAMRTIAGYLAGTGVAREGTHIIPAPQHSGRADYTREIADMVADATGADVIDVVRCVPHEPLYEQKRAGRDGNGLDLDFFIDGSVPHVGRLLLLDNVMGTGETYRRISDLLSPREVTPFVYAVDHGRVRGFSDPGHDTPRERLGTVVAYATGVTATNAARTQGRPMLGELGGRVR